MSDVHAAQSGGESVSAPPAAPVEEFKPENPKDLSVSDAARLLSSRRKREAQPEQTPAAPVQAAAEPTKSEAKAEDAAPPQEAPGETQESDPETVPPIEPPRSWSKEDKEIFASLPRETQERVSERERSRENDFLRRQNEAADKLKGLTAKEQAAEQARQQYEAGLPILLQQLHDVHMGEFADIKTTDDVTKLAREDWPRYCLWDAQQKKIAAVAQQNQIAQQRQAEQFSKQWNDFAETQDQKLLERAPELGDKTRAAKVADNAKQVLKDHGFTDQELGDLWNGKQALSLRDHRVQLLVLDGVKYREAKSAKPAPKPVPPVQRPGVSQPKGADDTVQALKEKFERDPSDRNAAALLTAKRKARAA